MDLFLNLDTEYVTRERRGAGSNTDLRLNQGDNRKIRLFLTKSIAGPELIEFVGLPSPYTLIQLAGRKADDLEGDELFYQGVWTQTTVTLDEGTDSEVDVTCYEAMLSTRTETIDTLMGEDATAVQEANILWSITLTDGDEAEWTVVPRGAGVMFRDIRRGEAAPTDLPPSYPESDQIAPITGVNFRFHNPGSGYVFQVKNTSTSKWHTVTIEGATGSEVFVLEAGV